MRVAKTARKIKRIQVEKSKKEQKVTGLAGLILYMEQMRAMGLWQDIEKPEQDDGLRKVLKNKGFGGGKSKENP